MSRRKSLVGLTIPERLEQTAVAASQPEAPQSGNSDEPLAGMQLQLRNLSVEHAAVVTQLDPRELILVKCLGRGWTDAEIAASMGRPLCAIRTWRKDLASATRMNRLSLAVLGYHLLGQESIDWQEAA